MHISQQTETVLMWVAAVFAFCLPLLTWPLRRKRPDMQNATGAKKLLWFFLHHVPCISVALIGLRFLQMRDIVGVHIPRGRIILGWVCLGYLIVLCLCLCLAGIGFLISMVRGKEDI